MLLIGRGAAYPALSVSLGERIGVVGALCIEAAAKHLNARDIDGIVLGEGFSPRVVDAFLTVLTEDARFRNLPVVMTSDALAPTYDLPNLEIISGEPAHIAANALPLIRQHAFEAHLTRTLRSIDAERLLDATDRPADARRPSTAISPRRSIRRCRAAAALSVARFAFDPTPTRAPIRWRADHQPADAADGFRRRPGRRLGHRGVRRHRSAQRPHDRAAAFQRDAAYRASGITRRARSDPPVAAGDHDAAAMTSANIAAAPRLE